mmetsp:Transcript_19659/g.47653  ORF Transcript_19659/g.47653 Transcript_19659/m.47653 type:complete len:203 (+) Transcript_19659:279-887(+)
MCKSFAFIASTLLRPTSNSQVWMPLLVKRITSIPAMTSAALSPWAMGFRQHTSCSGAQNVVSSPGPKSGNVSVPTSPTVSNGDSPERHGARSAATSSDWGDNSIPLRSGAGQSKAGSRTPFSIIPSTLNRLPGGSNLVPGDTSDKSELEPVVLWEKDIAVCIKVVNLCSRSFLLLISARMSAGSPKLSPTAPDLAPNTSTAI